MGLFDQMKNQVLGNAISSSIPGGQNPLLRAAIQLVMSSGGIGGLQQRLQSNGLGNIAESWIGSGKNMPINDQQISQVFGDDEISRVAQDNGIAKPDLTRQLSSLLPQLVDRATPEGRMPQQQPGAEGLLSAAKGLFGNKSH